MVRHLSIFVIFLFAISVFATSSYAQETVNSCPFVQPFFGRTECQIIKDPSTVIVNKNQWDNIRNDLFGAEWRLFDICGDKENSPECQPTFLAHLVPGSSTDSGLYNLKYRICTDFDENKCNPWIDAPGSGTAQGITPNLPYSFPIQLQKNQIIQVSVSSRFGVNPSSVNFDYISKFKAYGLVVYDNGAKSLYNVTSCNVQAIQTKDYGNICVSSLSTGFLGTGGDVCAKTLKQSTVLDYNDFVNYVSTYVYAPTDINNKVITYKGQQVYLQAVSGGINAYKIEKLETKSNCYSVPTSKINTGGDIQCVPGQTTANAICVQDGDRTYFKVQSTGACSNNNDCTALGSGYSCVNSRCVISDLTCFSDIQCPGQGSFTPDTSQVKTVDKWACQSNVCKVIATKKVECASSSDCGTGICDLSSFTCKTQEGGATPAPKQNGLDLLAILGNLFGAFILSVIIVVVLFALSFFVPPLRILSPIFSNMKFVVVAIFILTILIFFYAGGLTASILGGSI